jgi:signal transduction histidine kinase
VVAERVAFWSPLAEDQGRPVEVSLPDRPLAVRCGAEDLSAAVDALLENVIAHTPEGSALAIRLVAEDPGAVLQVLDNGPGIPATAAIRGRSDRGSTGLGLSIARRSAEASGGSMEVGPGPLGHGAIVTLRLGAA